MNQRNLKIYDLLDEMHKNAKCELDYSTPFELLVAVPDDELGRATKGAALGMMAATYLYAAGIIDSKYYADAAKTARVLVSGDLKGTYSLYQNGFAEMFYEDNEHNSEVIFDIQFAYP